MAKLGATVTTYSLLVVKSTGHNREQKTTLQMFCFLPLVFCCKIISKGRKTHVPLVFFSGLELQELDAIMKGFTGSTKG